MSCKKTAFLAFHDNVSSIDVDCVQSELLQTTITLNHFFQPNLLKKNCSLYGPLLLSRVESTAKTLADLEDRIEERFGSLEKIWRRKRQPPGTLVENHMRY